MPCLSSEYFSLQAGPVIKVKIPKDKDGKLKQFAFVNFKHEVSVPYAMNLLNGIKLFGRPIKIQFRSGNGSDIVVLWEGFLVSFAFNLLFWFVF